MYKALATLAFSLGMAIALSGSVVASDSEAARQPDKPESTSKTHEVAAGESLSLIAEAEKLESWRPLWDANPEVASPDLIYPGQKLVIPEGPTPERPLPAQAVGPAQAQAKVQSAGYSAKPVQRQMSAANYAVGAGGILERIRMRESGGNYAANTGNGYYGAYQFDLPTWRSNGGSGLPSEASPAEQDMRAKMLYERRGCNPWPNTCR